MPITDAALWSEISTDPLELGYANKTDQPAADTLNAKQYPVELTEVATEDFARAINPVFVNVVMRPASDPIYTKYIALVDLYKTWMQTFTTVHITDATVSGLLTSLVSDGLVTQAEVTALAASAQSRAEVLWGAGTVIDHLDVARVRNAQRPNEGGGE